MKGMLFKKMIHIAFFTDKLDEMMDFYMNKLGGELKVLTKYSVYKDRDDRPVFQKIAKEDPDRIFNAYIEIADGQSIELFPKRDDQKPQPGYEEYAGFGHFALLTDDIQETRRILKERGLESITELSKGPSETYQLWYQDPDGNRFEVMQYTNQSYQIVGHIDQ